MITELALKYSMMMFELVSVGILLLMARKRLFREFPLLVSLLCVQALDTGISLCILFYRKALGIEFHHAYRIYVYSHWVTFACESFLQVMLIYSVFSLAMKPLQGLHNIGKIIFRWVAGVSIAVSLAIAAGPLASSNGYSLTTAYAHITMQIQQGISVLTLCLLLFVCFSTKPLGLTYGSRVFGVTLGLGVMAATALVEGAWASLSVGGSLYSPFYLVGMLGTLASVCVWGTYFAMPEPERKLILLPTTSPFFFWNRISEALGDDPGHVAIAGFRPDMLAPAEMQMLSAPSMKRTELPADISLPGLPAMLQSATTR
jgi:hypothetical protein